MKDEFLKSNIQFEEYLNKKLMEISDLEKRRILKEITKNIMLPLYDYMESKYQSQIEQLKENETQSDYGIWIGLEEKQYVDLTEETMHPMNKADMDDMVHNTDLICKALENNVPYYIYTIFIEAGYKQIHRLINSGRIFKGKIITNSGNYQASFKLKECTRYREQVQSLYPVFIGNSIPWKTVNAAYLYKFADVELIGGTVYKDENIIGIEIDFEEYDSVIKKEIIPLWNIEEVTVKDSGYPELCMDRVHYKHTIFRHKLKQECSYLINNLQFNILSIEHRSKDIIITCNDMNDINWSLLKFSLPKKATNKYSLLGNEDKNESNSIIRTKGEIKKSIENMNYGEYLELKEIYINDYSACKYDNYDMNGELAGEIRQNGNRNRITLEFQCQGEKSFLSEDIISYVISRLQWMLPEYECCGRFIKEGAAYE